MPGQRTIRLSSLALAAAATSLLPACDPPLDSRVDSRLVAERTAAVYESAARAAAALDGQARPMARKLSPDLDRLLDRLMSQLPAGPGGPKRPAPADTGLTALRRMMVQTAGASDDEIARSAAALRRTIAEQVLTAQNVETAKPDEVIYLLRSYVTCKHPDTKVVDRDCAEFLDKVQLRLRMTRDRFGHGHDLQLRVGPKQLHPLTLTVRERELTVEAKLAALKPSADHISKQVDDPAPPLPAHMKGTVQLSLVANGARTATFALGLADLIDIRDPEQGLVIRTQAIDPDLSVLNVHLDGETRKLEASTRLGQTEIVFPLADRRQRPGAPDVRIFLPGVHGQGEFELDSQNIIFKDLGLGVGTTTVEVRGQRIFQVNLNPQDNWRFDAQVTFNQHDLPRIAITPRLDLQMMWKLMLIEADLASPPPPELRDMNFNLLIDALAGRPPVLEAIPDPLGGPDPRLKVVSGKLQLFSSTVITPVTAQAGQCLVPREPAPGEHPVLGAVSVTTCQ